MDKIKLIKCVKTIISLKEKLKCPICLDVMQDVVELDCGHKFCKSCYLEHKSTQKQVSCPLCKRILKRRSTIYDDNYASSLGKFVYNCCENIKSVYKCEVEQLLKQLSEETGVLQSKDNLQQNVISTNQSLAVPSTSKGITQTVKEKGHSREKHDTKKANIRRTKDESVKENCMSAFDKLMNTNQPVTTFNKKGAKRVYTNKKKSNKKPRVEYDILEFDNYANKTAVLQWLHDTRNKFDRLSQTQNIASDTSEVPVIDLVSVSQVNGTEDEYMPRRSKFRKKRAKSLDIEVKNAVPTQKKLNSQVRSASLENYNIEENTEEEVIKKAEEKVILDLIENEFLEALDSEMQATKTSDFDVKRIRCYPAKKKAKPLSPTLTTTGWERLTKIEKTIKKTERVPRQLNITTQSTQELKNENIPQANKETITKATDVSKRLLKVALTQTSFTKKVSNVLQKSNDDLKQTIITNEVVLIESEDESDKETNTHEAIDKRDDDLIQSVTGNEEAVIENKTRPPEHELHSKSCLEDGISEVKQNHRQTYDLEQLENYISKNIEVIDKNTSSDSDILLHVSLQEKMTADVQNRKELEVPNNRTSENCKEKENTDAKDSSSVLLDVLFNIPTQRISHSDNLKLKLGNEVIVIDDDDIEPGEPSLRDNRTLEDERDKKQNPSLDEITKMYDCPTQKIDHSCTDTTDKHNSTEGLLYLFEECLEKCITNLKSADLTVQNHLRNMQFYISKLKLLHRNNKIIQEKPIVTEVCDAETQIFIDAVNKTIQTESNGNNIGVQTENLHCIKCNIDLNENRLPDDVTLISQDTKAAIEHMVNETNIDFKPTLHSTVSNKPSASHLKPRSQYEEFTCTLDNLDFDTQELVNNQGTITIRKIFPKDTTHKSEATQSKAQTSLSGMENKTQGNIPGSVLVCSLDSDKSTVSKQVNRKLTYEADKSGKFKRIKRPASDSDSEEEKEAPAKRKCNRFLRDDLTVEFLTNSDVSNFKHNKTSNMESQDSEGVNYDEYLAEVMKKYEDNNFSNSPPNSFKKPVILSPKQELGKRHEEMISNTSKNINPLKGMPSELSTASSKDSFRTASNSMCNNIDDELAADNIFMNEENLLKLESDIRKYEKIVKAQSSEFSDIIGESEEFTPKKRKRTALNDIPSKDVENKKVFFKDLDLELCKVLKEEAIEKVVDDRKINILANVKIKSQDKKGEVKVDEDDLFSDEDIVETTPQKKVADGSAFSQISLNLINNSLPPPKETDNFDFDIVPLPPPPDFQDDVDIPSTPDQIPDDDATMIDLNKSSLTPDLSQFIFRSPRHSKYLSPCIKQIVKEKEGEQSEMRNISQKGEFQDDFSRTPDKLIPQKDHVKQRNVSHSTPIVDGDLIKESIGLSPISSKKSQKMGLTEMAHAAKYTPLNTVTKQTPQKQNLFTSTPKQKSIWNYVKSQSSEQAAPSIGKTKPCIACTRLTKNQVKLIDKLASKDLATFNSQFDGKVTHMIVSVNDNNWVKDYTIKFVSAVAAGIWVLRFDWIEECLKKDCIVSEEPFEVLDISGFPGPRTSRLTRKHNPLFMGYKFFCAEPFLSATKDEIENIVKMLGGKILPDLRSLLVDDGDIGIIIGEGHATQDFEQYEKWVETYRTVTVDIEWLSKCVGQYKILSIRPFVWCSEDNLCDLGYPSALTETVPLTFTETY